MNKELKITKMGYVMISVPNHPFAKNNYVYEHRLNIEKKLGRYLKKSEVIHHIDEDKSNNEIDNLMPFKTQKLHAKFHTKIRQFGITQPIKTQIKNRWNEYE